VALQQEKWHEWELSDMGLRKIAVLTSGGDAPGMNACIRAVVRCGVKQKRIFSENIDGTMAAAGWEIEA